MASWMTHMRLAGRLLERIPDLDAAQFGIGNIAPDGGVPDENWKNFDPPPDVTHFLHGKDHRGRNIHDLDFYRQFEGALAPGNPEAGQRSFLLGYFMHLLTDRLFDAYLWNMDHPELPFDAQTTDKTLIQRLRREWAAIDQTYLRDQPEAFFYTTFLGSEYTANYLPFLPTAAIQTRVELLKDIYQRRDERVQVLYDLEFEFFTPTDMEDFLAGVTEQLTDVYRAIWVDSAELDGFESAVQLFET